MHINDHQLITDDGQVLALPRLPYPAVVRVWRVPEEYRPAGLFVAVTGPGETPEVPACKHGSPELVVKLAADPDVEASAELERTTARYEQAVQAHMDAVARQHGYDNILSACSYAGVDNPYRADSEAFIGWRGTAWAYCYQALNEMLVGVRPQPTVAELLAELPPIGL